MMPKSAEPQFISAPNELCTELRMIRLAESQKNTFWFRSTLSHYNNLKY